MELLNLAIHTYLSILGALGTIIGYLGESFHLECGQPLQTIVSSVYLFLSQKVGTILYELVLASSFNRER